MWQSMLLQMDQCMGTDVRSITIFARTGQISLWRRPSIEAVFQCGPVLADLGCTLASCSAFTWIKFISLCTFIIICALRGISNSYFLIPRLIPGQAIASKNLCFSSVCPKRWYYHREPAPSAWQIMAYFLISTLLLEKSSPLFHFQMSLQKLTMGTLMKRGITWLIWQFYGIK